MSGIAPFIARHPGGLDPAMAAEAREGLKLLADAMDRFIAHLGSGVGGPSPLDDEGIDLTVTRSSASRPGEARMISVRMRAQGRAVCAIDAQGTTLSRMDDLFPSAKTIIRIAKQAIESASMDPVTDGPRDRMFDHPSELVAAWRAVGTLARSEMVRVGGEPFDHDVVRANVVGETPLSDFAVDFDLRRTATSPSSVHLVDPRSIERLRIPGAVDVMVSRPNGAITVTMTPHLQEIVSDASDTMVLMRAEGDLARYRSMHP